jgi:hypothetical protein
MALGFGSSSLEARVSYLEQLIIIIIIGGGGYVPGRPPVGDSFSSDTTRFEALARLVGRGPPGDPFSADISRLSLAEAEDKANEVAATITRLQAHQGELHARVKELRTKSS